MRSACSARRVSKPSPPAATSGTESSTASRTTNSKRAGGPRGSAQLGAARSAGALRARSVFPSGPLPADRRSGETTRRGQWLRKWRPRRAGTPGPGGTGETWSHGARPEQGAAHRPWALGLAAVQDAAVPSEGVGGGGAARYDLSRGCLTRPGPTRRGCRSLSSTALGAALRGSKARGWPRLAATARSLGAALGAPGPSRGQPLGTDPAVERGRRCSAASKSFRAGTPPSRRRARTVRGNTRGARPQGLAPAEPPRPAVAGGADAGPGSGAGRALFSFGFLPKCQALSGAAPPPRRGPARRQSPCPAPRLSSPAEAHFMLVTEIEDLFCAGRGGEHGHFNH